MARIPNGILGDFIGTAGNVSGYMRYGQNFIRTRRRKSGNVMTPQRLAQQQKMKVCGAFLKPFAGRDFFNKTFPANGGRGSGYNRATSSVMNQAITGSYPHFAIAYPLVLVSKGSLPAPVQASASRNAAGNIVFNWQDNTGTGSARATDTVVLVACFTETREIIFSTNAGKRSDGQAVLDTHLQQGSAAETWIGFLSADEKNAADSVYSGRVVL